MSCQFLPRSGKVAIGLVGLEPRGRYSGERGFRKFVDWASLPFLRMPVATGAGAGADAVVADILLHGPRSSRFLFFGK